MQMYNKNMYNLNLKKKNHNNRNFQPSSRDKYDCSTNSPMTIHNRCKTVNIKHHKVFIVFDDDNDEQTSRMLKFYVQMRNDIIENELIFVELLHFN